MHVLLFWGSAGAGTLLLTHARSSHRWRRLLVFANKQDLPNALPSDAIAERLGLGSLKSRQWQIFRTSAIKGDGLFEGLDWLVASLREGK